MKRLNDKLCIVTGAAQGIGRAIAELYVSQGASVVLTDKDVENGEKSARELDCEFAKLDVSSEKDWHYLAERFSEIDVLVNNAGITGFENGFKNHDPENANLEDWREVHATNLDGTFLGCRYAIAAMKSKGEGSIINMSSRSCLVGIPGAAAYASSKAAIRNHTKTVALYCAQIKTKIRCNSIHPAAVLTPIWEPMLGEGEDRQKNMDALVADTPLKRFAMPEEIAEMALYLASDASAYVTGSEFNIDGGLLAGSAAAPG